jgi:hypothetical protein
MALTTAYDRWHRIEQNEPVRANYKWVNEKATTQLKCRLCEWHISSHRRIVGHSVSTLQKQYERLVHAWRQEIGKAVTKFISCDQFERLHALDELVKVSLQGDPIVGMRSALSLILGSGLHERTSAAIEFLTRLGPIRVKQIVSTAERFEGGRFGYALVRALGSLGERDYVLRLATLQDESVREAVAEALDDIADVRSLQELRKMHEQDPSDFIRRLAGELLQDH